MRLSSHEMAWLALQVGFDEPEAVKIVSIAMATSNGDTEFLQQDHSLTDDHDQLHGLTGISSRYHSDKLGMGDWRDPLANMQMAKAIYDQNPSGFINFPAFVSKEWKQFEILAHFGVETPIQPPNNVSKTLSELHTNQLENRISMESVVNSGMTSAEAMETLRNNVRTISESISRVSRHFI